MPRRRKPSGGVRDEKYRGRILLVDDEPYHMRRLVDRLERAGYVVELATDLSEGAAKALHRPDLVLVDMMMPCGDPAEHLRGVNKEERHLLESLSLERRYERSGLSLIEWLLEFQLLPANRIIVLSALGSLDAMSSVMAQGVVHLCKPTMFQHVLEVIEQALAPGLESDGGEVVTLDIPADDPLTAPRHRRPDAHRP